MFSVINLSRDAASVRTNCAAPFVDGIAWNVSPIREERGELIIIKGTS